MTTRQRLDRWDGRSKSRLVTLLAVSLVFHLLAGAGLSHIVQGWRRAPAPALRSSLAVEVTLRREKGDSAASAARNAVAMTPAKPVPDSDKTPAAQTEASIATEQQMPVLQPPISAASETVATEKSRAARTPSPSEPVSQSTQTPAPADSRSRTTTARPMMASAARLERAPLQITVDLSRTTAFQPSPQEPAAALDTIAPQPRDAPQALARTLPHPMIARNGGSAANDDTAAASDAGGGNGHSPIRGTPFARPVSSGPGDGFEGGPPPGNGPPGRGRPGFGRPPHRGPGGFGRGPGFGGGGPPGAGGFPDSGRVFAVYVLDCSSSMRDRDKIGYALAALRSALAELQPGDMFEVIPFGDEARPLWRDFLPASPDAEDSAMRRLQSIRLPPEGDGSTNYSAAFDAALSFTGETHVFFLTDGIPSSGYGVPESSREAIDYEAIRDYVRRKNAAGVHIYTFAITDGRQWEGIELLQHIAEDNGGVYRRIDVPEPPTGGP